MAAAVTGLLEAATKSSIAPISFLTQLQQGFPMPKIALIALTLFPPTGIIGLNWIAVGNSSIAFIKALSFVFITFTMIFLMPFFPAFIPYKIISIITLFGPWWAYDIIQVLDKTFDTEGFILPLPIKDLPAQGKLDENGKWKLTLPLGSMIIATIIASGIAIADYVPSSMQTYVTYASAGGGTLFTSIAAISGLTSTPASTILGSTTLGSTTLGSTTTSTLLQGGGSKEIPPLSAFVDQLRYKKTKSTDEAFAFFSILGIIVLGGIATTVFKPATR